MFPLQKFQDFVAQKSLLSGNEKVLLTVSGGKDSVLMAHLFKLSGYHFGIAHCNFNLRGEESSRDENFVKMLASTMEVPFHVVHFDTRTYAAEHKISTQMAARTLRYDWFERIRKEQAYNLISVAHHQNDVIETLLLNLTRGTGIAGLHGILPKKGFLIRPMLCFSGEEIEQAIENNRVSYVEDSSNASDKYARNKIRSKVIPLLKSMNPNLEATFEHNVRRFSEAEALAQKMIGQIRSDVVHVEDDLVRIGLKTVRDQISHRLLLFELLKPYHFAEAVSDEILDSAEGASGLLFYSSSHQASLNRGELILRPLAVVQRQPVLLNIHPQDAEIIFEGRQILVAYTEDLRFESNPLKAFVDADRLVYPLILRKWEQGDRFIPLGMQTFKKLSDFFIDEKVPLPLKDQVPVLVNGNGELIWIGGMRQDNRYKLTSATKKVAIFELKIS